MQLIDNSIQQLDDFSELLNNTGGLDNVLISSSPKDIELQTITEIKAELPRFYDANSLVNGYYIYGIKNQTMWSRNQVYYDPSMYYGYGIRYGDLTYDAWRQCVSDSSCYSVCVYPATSVTLNGQSSLRLMYTYPYYNKTGYTLIGRIIYFLDVRAIMDVFGGAFDMGASSICILDEHGVPLLETVPGDGLIVDSYSKNAGIHEIDTDNGAMLMTNAVSSRYGWNYAIFISKTVIAQRAHSLLQTTLYIVYTVIAFTMIILFAGYFVNAAPLLSVAQKLNISRSVKSGHKNGLWQIDEAVNRLITDKSHLQSVLEKQNEQMEDALLLRLINGGMIRNEDVIRLLKRRGIEQSGSMRGVYMRFLDIVDGNISSSDNLKREIARKCIQETDFGLIPLIYVSESDMALLLMRDEESGIKDKLMLLSSIITKKCGNEVAFSVGHAVPDFSELYKSFARARLQFADRIENSSRGVLMENSSDIDRYDYSNSNDEYIVMLAREGNASRLDAFLLKIYENNFIRRSLNHSMRIMLQYRLIDALLMVNPHALNDCQLAEIMELPLESFYETLRALFKKYCEDAASRQEEERKIIEGEIPKYIEDHLYDPELSLTALSVHFKLTESYLSVLVKQLMNENFSSYLENRRIRRAAEMLEVGDGSVGEIAATVGYLSANSFSRAFKRVMGFSPTEYVRMCKGKMKEK